MNSFSSFASQIASYFIKIVSEPKEDIDAGLLHFYKIVKSLYIDIFENNVAVGLLIFENVQMDDLVHHSKDTGLKKGKKSVKPFLDILRLIYDVARLGEIKNNKIYAPKELYVKSIKNQKTIKK